MKRSIFHRFQSQSCTLQVVAIVTLGIVGLANSSDSNNDGLNDQWQSLYYVPPFAGAADYDGDGRINLVESINFSDPWTADVGLGIVAIQDTNPADGMDDTWQQTFGIPSSEALADPDSDNRKNIEESIVFSNPFVADAPWQQSGSSGTVQTTPSAFSLSLPFTIPTTRYRLQTCTDMKTWVDVPGAATWAGGEPIGHTLDTTGDNRRFFRYFLDWPDDDFDGLPDWYEVKVFNTSITSADSDEDGWSDGEEVAGGSSPNDGGDSPEDADDAYVYSRLNVESQALRLWDDWTGYRWQSPDPGPEEWYRTHYWRSIVPGGIDEGLTPSAQQYVQGPWSPPALPDLPSAAAPAELPWGVPEQVGFAGQFGYDYTPFAMASVSSFSSATYKKNQWQLEWKRFRIVLTEPLPHDVRKFVKIRKKTFTYTESAGWTETASVEDTRLTLTIHAGSTASGYTYLLPSAGQNQRVEYWVTAGGDGIQLLTVGFRDEEYNTRTTIKSDDGETVYNDSYEDTGPGQWVDADGDRRPDPSVDPSEHNWPLAFQAGSTMSLHAQISVPDLAAGTAVVVEAKRTGFVKVKWEVTATGGLLELPRQASSIPLPDSVQCFSHHSTSDAFTLDWSIKIGNQAVQKLGKTHHTLYSILHHTGSAKEETLYALACRATIGRTTANYGLVSAIFHEFTDREVCLVKPTTSEEDGTPMTYRHDTTVSLGGDYSTLLKDKKGRCGHWAKLFQEVLYIHGITHLSSFPNSATYMVIRPTDETAIRSAFSAAWADYGGGSPAPDHVPRIFIHSWLVDGAEFTVWNPLDLQGVPAQGNPDPRSDFSDHVVVEYAGKIFDPSYGYIYNSYADWESSALQFLGIEALASSSPVLLTNYWVGIPNSPARETTETPN